MLVNLAGEVVVVVADFVAVVVVVADFVVVAVFAAVVAAVHLILE